MSESKVLNFGPRGARAGVDWMIGADRSFTFAPWTKPRDPHAGWAQNWLPKSMAPPHPHTDQMDCGRIR